MKTFKEIPLNEPKTLLLDKLSLPKEIKNLSKHDLNTLADEVREFLLYTVGSSGGHFGAGLGVVELTVALHHIFDSPSDMGLISDQNLNLFKYADSASEAWEIIKSSNSSN